jgi:hypothetical protein
MFEHRTRPLLNRRAFLRRAGRHLVWAGAIVACSVSAGTLGYHVFGRLVWIDAFLNASMILGGMGPVDRMETSPAKLFAAVYALFSGLVFIGIMGVVLAPWLHRLIHRFHLEDELQAVPSKDSRRGHP